VPLFKVLRRFFPRLQDDLDALPDPRARRRVVYPVRSLVWSGVLLFFFHLKARRRLRFDLNGPGGLANLRRLSEANLATLPHGDTEAYLLERLSPQSLEGVVCSLTRLLIRSRALEEYRLLNKFYLVAADGTEFLAFGKPHCEACQTQRLSNGDLRYYHPVLDAKLICANGLVVPMGAEFMLNRDGETKQDCEPKALRRLLPRLRCAFPRLSICLLLDGLYLGAPLIRLCRERHCAWIVTFKEGSAPALYREWRQLLALCPENSLEESEDGVHRRFRWVNGLDHKGETLNVFECQETRSDAETKTFVWATCLEVHRANVVELAMGGGRLRWKIENEGFKTLKREGYEMEHAYSENWNAAQNFYHLMHMAHLLIQIIHRSGLLKAPVQRLFGSVQAFVARLLEAWRCWPVDTDALESALASGYQIRFDTS
jgi:hypothetical protein